MIEILGGGNKDAKEPKPKGFGRGVGHGPMAATPATQSANAESAESGIRLTRSFKRVEISGDDRKYFEATIDETVNGKRLHLTRILHSDKRTPVYDFDENRDSAVEGMPGAELFPLQADKLWNEYFPKASDATPSEFSG